MATLPRAVQRQVEAAEALLTGADQPAETQTAVLETPPEPQQEPTAQVVAPAPEPSPALKVAEKPTAYKAVLNKPAKD